MAESGARHDHDESPTSDEPSFGVLAAAMVACCAIPMLAIVVLVSVVGVAFGIAIGVALGLVAAGVCVALMVLHRRHRAHRPSDDRSRA